MEQGVFLESLNLAALMKVPVLFLCQDNGLAVHSHLNERQSFDIKLLVSATVVLNVILLLTTFALV